MAVGWRALSGHEVEGSPVHLVGGQHTDSVLDGKGAQALRLPPDRASRRRGLRGYLMSGSLLFHAAFLAAGVEMVEAPSGLT